MDIFTKLIVDRMVNSTRREAAEEGGRKIVACNLGVKLLAGLFPLLPLGGLWLALDQGVDEPLVVYGFFGGFGLLSAFLIHAAFLTSLSFDDHSIHFSSPLYRDRQISWATITGGGYSATMNCYYIATADIGRIWVSPMQHGWADILWMAGGKLREQRGEDPFGIPPPGI